MDVTNEYRARMARHDNQKNMTRIGPHEIGRGLILAPMAGVTDQPFRKLCRQLGADMAVSEMVTADARLWHTPEQVPADFRR